MKIKIALATATAMGLLMGGAWAGEENFAVVEQAGPGGGHSASIVQNGDRNMAGDNALNGLGAYIRPIRQSAGVNFPASENVITILQEGNDNKVGVAGGGAGMAQNGPDNSAVVNQYTSGNRVNILSQQNVGGLRTGGTANSATVDQGAAADAAGTASNNFISRIMQTATQHAAVAGNSLSVFQEGGAGANNTIGIRGYMSTGAGFGLIQDGVEHTMAVDQRGSDNTILEIIQGGGATNGRGNWASINQNGSTNTITTVRQTSHVNTGAGNSATVYQYGNLNRLALIDQDSSDELQPNSVFISITGDFNGALGLSSAAAASGAGSSSVIQDGGGNDVSLSIVGGGSSNEFGFTQLGDRNSVGNVEISGSSNELGVYQNGNDNSLDLSSIAGSENTVGLEQMGDWNLASLDIGGNNNGGGSFTAGGVAGALAGTRPSGLITQLADAGTTELTRNSVSLAISTDFNQFSILQDGSQNTVNGTIDGGNNNEVAVLQDGTGNFADFSQLGGTNNLAISQ